MKRVISVVGVAAALVVLVSSAPAAASSSPERRIAALEAQVRALSAQIKSLKRQVVVVGKTVDSNQVEFRKEASRNRVGDACIALSIADLLQSTWANVDGRVPGAAGFGPQRPLDDVSCNAIGVARPGLQNHPAVDVFWALTGWLIG